MVDTPAPSTGASRRAGDVVRLESARGYRLWFDRDDLLDHRRNRPDALRTALERRGLSIDLLRDEKLPGGPDHLYGDGTSGANAVRAALFPSVRVTFLGSCLTQFAEEAVHEIGLRQGLDPLVSHRWLGTASVEALATELPDLVVVQSGAQALLEPIFRTRSTSDLTRVASGVGAVVARLIEGCRRNAPEATIVVHTVAPPAIWPPSASQGDWSRAWATLNDRIAEAAREAGAVVLDEAALAYVHGAANVFDDLCFPWTHHGGATDLAIENPNQRPEVHQILAETLWDSWKSVNLPTIKAIVTDLDGVLWPGVTAESGFQWLNDDKNSSWMHLGIQEAIRAYERAGLVLASLSRGDEEVTLGLWSDHASLQPLGPDAFALHSISWEPKVDRMEKILQLLQTTPDRVLFIDDHPAERAAIRLAFPTMHVLGDDIRTLRAELLRNRLLRRSVAQGTRASRTGSTRAAVQREQDRVDFSEEEFREHLGVEVDIRPTTLDDLPRVQELLARTTQFSLGNGWSMGEVLAQEDPLSVMVMRVADRYSDYGLVGVSVVDRHDPLLRAYALSCRVIGLDVSDTLLDAHMKRLGLTEIAVDLVETSRNGVMREALARWGLSRVDGRYHIKRKADTDALEHASRRTDGHP